MATKRKKTKAPSRHRRVQHHHPNFWAVATLLAFPAVMLTVSGDVSSVAAFLYGLLASFGVLVANVLVEHRLWMFDPVWKERFDHPEFAFRAAVLCGALLLVLQSAFLALLVSDPGLDRTLLTIVQARECQAPEAKATDLCLTLQETLGAQLVRSDVR